jgi:hypothetical protein
MTAAGRAFVAIAIVARETPFKSISFAIGEVNLVERPLPQGAWTVWYPMGL